LKSFTQVLISLIASTAGKGSLFGD